MHTDWQILFRINSGRKLPNAHPDIGVDFADHIFVKYECFEFIKKTAHYET